MARLTVDVELLMVELLTAALPNAEVVAKVDAGADLHTPAVVVQPVNGAMISNGAPGLGWSWLIALSILGNGHQYTSDFADHVYAAMHGFEDNQSVLPGVGCVTRVEDSSMPIRTATIVTANNLTQYDGAWQITVTPVST